MTSVAKGELAAPVVSRRASVVLIGAVVFAFIAGVPAAALAPTPYLQPDAVDFTTLLPPPPAADSQAQRDDVATVIAVQSAASPARRRQAIVDAEVSPEVFAGALLGPAFTAAQAPKTFELLRRAVREMSVRSLQAKDVWNRPRPFVIEPRVQMLLVERPNNPAYPSGHATYAYELAVILGAMLPEQRAALFARAVDYGQSRIIAGVHFHTDIEAGRSAGTAIAAVLLATPQFRADLADATAELRQALGMAAAAK